MFRARLILAVVLAAAIAAPAALANSPRITRGDANALLQAIATAGAKMQLQPGVHEGAPAQTIGRIGTTPNYNGRHFCSLDWHLISVFFLGGPTHKAAVATLDAYVVDIRLDGASLALERTAIKPALAADGDFWLRQWGAILSPTDLTVGAHTVQLFWTGPLGSFSLPSIAIFVDAPGTGACL